MKNNAFASRAEQPLKSELIITIPFLLLSAHLFVGFRQKCNYLELFMKKGYVPAFLATLFIASLMILYVRYVTQLINRKFPLSHGKRWKLFAHLFYGVLCTLVLEFALTAQYFALFAGVNISETVYFDSYLLPILCFITILNLYYTSAVPVERELAAQRSAVQPDANKQQDHSYLYEGMLEYALEKGVAYITAINKTHYAKTADGEAVFWDYSIVDSIAGLADHGFFQVSRSQIIRRDIIAEIVRNPLERQLTVVLKAGFDKFESRIKVPGNRIADFKKWYAQP